MATKSKTTKPKAKAPAKKDAVVTAPIDTKTPAEEISVSAATATKGAEVGETKPVDEAAEDQFPALDGQDEVEIAKRSADETKTSATTFRKDFVIPGDDFKGGDKTAIHENNERSVRQFLINQGLRPIDDKISHKSEPHPDGVSVILIYRAEVVPAVVATDERVAHAGVNGLIPAHEGDEDTK